MNRTTTLRTAAFMGAAGLAAAALATASPAGAQTSAGYAEVRTAHLSPTAPGVDVYLTAFSGGSTKLVVPDEAYGGVSKYMRVAAGQYVVSMRVHGAPKTAKAILTWNLDATANQAYTAAAVGSGSKMTGTVLKDDLTPPKAGYGRVRLIQAASRAPEADVTAVNGPVIAMNAAFPTSTGYAQVPAGTWPLQAKATSGSLSTSAKVSVAKGSVTSVLLLDSKSGSGVTLTSVLDAASAGVSPKGSVDAGGGGTAPNRPSSSVLPLASGGGIAALLLAGGAWLVALRRRPVARHTVK